MNDRSIKKYILPIIVIAQFFCTSLWFAGNAILADLLKAFHLEAGFLANLTSAVQFGFISGTLAFALLAIADRYSPSLVFFGSAVLASLFNLGIILPGIQATGLLVFRFGTGFFLAGIYPVGMKIAADYFQKGLGKSLGFLVGALVLGTAFPHFLKSISAGFSWQFIVIATSILAIVGGILIWLFVPDGPYRKTAQKLDPSAFLAGFRQSNFRAVAFGYFGHMWELYTFWAFVPVMLTAHNHIRQDAPLAVSFWSFLIIASGSLACVGSGLLSQRFGARKIAAIALALSGLCCLLSPWLLWNPSNLNVLIFLFFWGMVVIADSPLFSSLVAQNAPEASRGTALTIVNCIGFSITIISIQAINAWSGLLNMQYVFLPLAAGAVLGLIALIKSPAA